LDKKNPTTLNYLPKQTIFRHLEDIFVLEIFWPCCLAFHSYPFSS